MSREAESSGEHPAYVEVRNRVLSPPPFTPSTRLAFLWAGSMPSSRPPQSTHPLHTHTPICRQQLFLTGVPLSTADGDQNGPVGRQCTVPPPAHADAVSDIQISPHSILRHLASGCR